MNAPAMNKKTIECQRVHTNWVENQKCVSRDNIFSIWGFIGVSVCMNVNLLIKATA